MCQNKAHIQEYFYPFKDPEQITTKFFHHFCFIFGQSFELGNGNLILPFCKLFCKTNDYEVHLLKSEEQKDM